MNWISINNIPPEIIDQIFGGCDESKEFLVSDGVGHCYGFAERNPDTKQIKFSTLDEDDDYFKGEITMFFIIPEPHITSELFK